MTNPTPTPTLPARWIIAATVALLAPAWWAWLTNRGIGDTIIAITLGAATAFATIAIAIARTNR